jgi:hypothetical protein
LNEALHYPLLIEDLQVREIQTVHDAPGNLGMLMADHYNITPTLRFYNRGKGEK